MEMKIAGLVNINDSHEENYTYCYSFNVIQKFFLQNVSIKQLNTQTSLFIFLQRKEKILPFNYIK